MTGRDAVTASLRLIGAIAPSESVSASEATDGLATLNRMLDSWSNENLVIYTLTAETPLTLTPGDGTVTMGTSGDITTRPMSIEKALIRDGTTDYNLRILTLDEYTRIGDKTTQSTLPTSIYDDGGYPQRTLTLYPVPSAAKSLVLYTKRAITQIATLDTSLSLPQGYEEALIYNLAMRLAPEYGKTPSELIFNTANETKASIKRKNFRPSLLRCDSALVSNTTYDIMTGDYR